MTYTCARCGRRFPDVFFVGGFDKRLGVLFDSECLDCRGLPSPRQDKSEENAREKPESRTTGQSKTQGSLWASRDSLPMLHRH